MSSCSTSRPKRYYADIAARKRTFDENMTHFDKWMVCTNELAEAGFYSIGFDDWVKCFSCDGGLCRWERGDDPWIEHAKHYGHVCAFLKEKKSRAFIEMSKNLNTFDWPWSKPLPKAKPPTAEETKVFYSTPYDEAKVKMVAEWLGGEDVYKVYLLRVAPLSMICEVLERKWIKDRQPFPCFEALHAAVLARGLNPTTTLLPIGRTDIMLKNLN